MRPEEPLLPPPVKTIRKVQSTRAATKVKGGKKEAHCPDAAYREDTVHKRIQRESSIKSIRLLGIKSMRVLDIKLTQRNQSCPNRTETF